MSQLPPAYEPAATFRPASGWQFGAQPSAPAVSRTVDGVRRPLATALLLVAAYLVIVQGIVAVTSASDVTPLALADSAFTWLAGGATLAVLFATTSRAPWILVATGIVAAIDAIAYVVLGATGLLGVWDPPIVAVALVLSTAGAVVGIVAVRSQRPSLATTSLVLAILGVVAFYAISIVSPIVALGLTDQTIAGAIRTPFVPLVAILAGVLLSLDGRRAGILGGVALVALALSFLVTPVVSAMTGSPSGVGVLLVVALRIAVVLGAAVVVLLGARRS